MHLTAGVLALLVVVSFTNFFFSISIAFRIPTNITTGFYAVTIDRATGQEIHTRLDDLPPPPRSETDKEPSSSLAISRRRRPSPPLSPAGRNNDSTAGPDTIESTKNRKRSDGSSWPPRAVTYCGDSYIQASDLRDKAQVDFADQCERTNAAFLTSLRAVYAAYGTAVAYMCNFSESGNPCSSAEWLDALGLIAEKCKWSQGTVLQTGEFLSVCLSGCLSVIVYYHSAYMWTPPI